MSTPAEVRTSWATNLWSKAAMTALTTQIFSYDPLQIQSLEGFSELLFDESINFITYLTIREPQLVQVNCITYRYQVLVSRYIEVDHVQDVGQSYHQVTDDLTTIEATIRGDANFNKGWNNVVDYWVLKNNPPITSLQIAGRSVWVGQSLYEGTKTI